MKYIEEYKSLFESTEKKYLYSRAELYKIEADVKKKKKFLTHGHVKDPSADVFFTFVVNRKEKYNDDDELIYTDVLECEFLIHQSEDYEKNMFIITGDIVSKFTELGKLDIKLNPTAYITHPSDLMQVLSISVNLNNSFPLPTTISNLISRSKEFIKIEDGMSAINEKFVIEYFAKEINTPKWIKYWDKKIEENPTIYGEMVRKGIKSKVLDKKWKHLGAEFGLV